jgi:hypothetical protein
MTTPKDGFITVLRIKPTHTDSSSLQLDPKSPDRLRVVGVLPHGVEIGFDPENRAYMRDWLASQESLADLAERFAKEIEKGEVDGYRDATKRLTSIAEDLAQPARLRTIARKLRTLLRG